MYKQKSLTHRILAMLLAIVMMVGYLPTAWAASDSVKASFTADAASLGSASGETTTATLKISVPQSEITSEGSITLEYQIDPATSVSKTAVIKSDLNLDTALTDPGWTQKISSYVYTETIHNVPARTEKVTEYKVSYTHPGGGGSTTTDVLATDSVRMEPVPVKPVISTLTFSSSNIKLGETFTATATSDVGSGYITFEYDGLQRKALVDSASKTATASFIAVDGATKVTAYQHSMGSGYVDSDSKTETITATALPALTISELKVTDPSSGSVTEGERFTVTATTIEADGRVAFEYDGVKKTAAVNGNTASASFDAVYGVTEVSAYQYGVTGYTDSAMQTATVTVTAFARENIQFDMSLCLAGTNTEITSIVAGQTVRARAHVAHSDWNTLTDAAGAIVMFTWPDGTISYGYLNQTGWAEANWTVPDTFADSLIYDGRSNWNLTYFHARFFGTEKYAPHKGTGANLRIHSRTIAQGTAAIAVDGTGSLAVNKTSTLSLTGEVKDTQGVVLSENTNYTVAWYENTGSGVWTAVADPSAVKPLSTSYSYKAVVSPKGNQYSQGEFELVVSCGTEDTSVFGSTAAITVVEGEAFTVSAVVNGTNNGGAAVAGGSVAFWADDIYLGTAPIVAGQAGLTVDGTKLSEGTYHIKAAYSGTPGVFSSIALTDLNVDIEVASATLDDTKFTLKNTADTSKLVIGESNVLSIAVAGLVYIYDDDYSIIWQVSKDGGVSWAEAARTATYTLTPENNLYQVRAVVMPEGDYTKPVNGFVVGPMACDASDKVKTAIELSAVPDSVFAGDTVVLTAVVTDENGNAVSSGSVTITGNGSSITLPVDQGGMVQYIVPVTATTTFEATYNGNDIYKESTSADVNVTVKTREIEWKTGADTITTSDAIAVGNTVTLTAPEVQSTDGYSLTAGTHFYYQWQYCEDYDGTGTDYTAIWKNFSAPDSDNGKNVRVTIATANTAFRVIAVPYGDYRYPAQGVMTDPICGNSGKITTSIDKIDIASVQHGNVIYDGDDVQFKVQVKAGTANVPEGYVTFSVSQHGTSWRTIGTAVVNNSGVAVLDYKAYAGQVGKVSARYNATSRYKGCTTEADVTIKSVKIDTIEDASKIALAPGSSWTVGTAATIKLPTVKSTDGTPLSLGTDYFIEWFEDHGYGWSSKMLMYSGLNYTFTPQNENSKLAAIVRPKGNYSLPAEGVSAGVLSNAAKINTTTELATSIASAYEGDEITLTATIEAGGAVLDGKVDFYAKVNDATETCIGSASVNGEGKAILTYTLPSYATLTSSKVVVFSAKYLGTDAYAASEATATDSKKVAVKSATITFNTTAPAITIEFGTGETQPAVGKPYKLTAPDVYEQGTTTLLTCGTHYYYVWDRSIDGGVTWETVQSTTDANSKSLKNAIFVNDKTEFRATAYPITGSGSIYRYPVTGITVMTNTTPTTKETTATVTLSNEYAKSGDVAIYPVGRDIVIKATVVTDDTDKAPATGKVTFHQKGSTDVEIGSAFLNPVGEAELTIPAPATAGEYVYYVEYAGNEVFTADYSDKDTVNAAVLPNAIKMDGALKITSDGSTEVTDPVVGVTYTLTGAYATVNTTEYATYVTAANDKLSSDPYFYYQWQKSEDGGETWVSLDNPVASNGKPSLNVTFDTDLTQYRLAAYPIASTGWINPTTGVTSNAKGVGTTATTTAITLKDKATGETLTSGSEISEGRTVLVTVNVSGIADYTPGTDGWVKLSTYAKKAAGTSVALDTQTAKVMNDGNVTFDVVLPAYSYKFATRMNEIFFDAEFSGDNHFKDSNSVGDAKLNLLSAAIAWNVVASGASADSVRTITIYKGTTIDDSTKLATSESMVANQDYTLKLPTIMAADVDKITGDRVSAPRKLTNSVEYTVDWQRQLKGGATQTGWQTIPTGNGGDTLYIAADAGAQDYSYRAVVIPKGDYQFAMKDDFSDLNPTNTLTTAATADTELAATTTTLVVKDVIAEAADVAINGATNVFTAEHNTQYEGENVTLEATIKVTADDKSVPNGLVYFYRAGTTDLLNAEGVAVVNGKATLTVPTSAFAGTANSSKDSYYAKYLGTDVYATSTSATKDVYIRSTKIEVPRIGATAFDGSSTPVPAWTTKSAGASVQSATNLTFKLMTDAANGNDTYGWSVTAKDGRWLKSGTDFTTTWHLNESILDGAGSIIGLPSALGEGDTWTLNNGDFGQEYFAFLKPIGHMTVGAKSQNIAIGDRINPNSTEIKPEITFDVAGQEFHADVADADKISGSHYGDEITLTAYVTGHDVLPTGTVDFYYTVDNNSAHDVKINADPVHLTAKGTTGADALIAVATIDTTELPLNTKSVYFTYSGDRNYNAVTADKKEYKVWSVQISNPVREDVTLPLGSVDYSDPACYPDNKSYGNVSISIFKATKTGSIYSKGTQVTGSMEITANGDYILELNDVYTKSGEKLIATLDNSTDYLTAWYRSEDGGNTWIALRETEYENVTADSIYVKPATKDTKYMVKVTTNNSFYNHENASLVDFEYSEKNVDTVLQEVTVSVKAIAETPVDGKNEWVYHRNPITLYATVAPDDNGEPSGHVKFYYAPEGTDLLATTDWTEVKSITDGTNVAELKKVTSGTDMDGKMVAEITTIDLPVNADGTYKKLAIKAVYTGDQTFETEHNTTSPVVIVFSSTVLQDTTIENQPNVDAEAQKFNGVVIKAKELKSDGTPAMLELLGVYTRDMDKKAEIAGLTGVSNPADAIYTMDNTEYSIEWQYCEDYEVYKDALAAGNREGANWKTFSDSTDSKTFRINQVQGNAFRAKITLKDAPKSKAGYDEYKINLTAPELDSYRVVYSNILVVGDAEARLLVNARKASSAAAKGETVYIDTILMGGSTTPIGSTEVKITEKRTSEVVYDKTLNVVNGNVTHVWENVQPGEYTIEATMTGNNGYTAKKVTQDYIVRFTAEAQNGDEKYSGANTNGDLALSLSDKTVVYNGREQFMTTGEVTGFSANYGDWKNRADKSIVYKYYTDEACENRIAEPVNAGTYYVKAYLPETMYYGYVESEVATFKIDQRELVINDIVVQAKTYDGTNNANIQTVSFKQAEQGANGLPTGDIGLIEGDSVYAVGTTTTASVNAGTTTVTFTPDHLEGPHAGNYKVPAAVTEPFTIARNQLTASAYSVIKEKPGYKLTDDDFKMVDQQGNALTVNGGADITYYYHSGNDIKVSENTNRAGKYTVVIGKKSDNYKGGATVTLYVDNSLTRATEGAVTAVSSAMIDITDTYHVYDGEEKSVKTNVDATVEYAGNDGAYTRDKPKNAGRYMVKATANGRTYYGIMTIVKGDPGTSLTAESMTYDGTRYNDYTLNTADSLYMRDNNNTTGTYGDLYYSYVGGSIVGSSLNAPRDVSYVVNSYVDSETSGAYDNYMVTAHVPETANTIRKNVDAAFEIKKAGLTITADSIYTRRFDTHSYLTAQYDGFLGDGYGLDSNLRDLIARPTLQLGADVTGLSNTDLTQVGHVNIKPELANARNYTVTYVDGIASTNANATQDKLAIRGEPQGSIYYGDSFDLFLYGSRGKLVKNPATDSTCESSIVTWKSSNEDVATIDAQGHVTIKGVGEFTITATRGDDDLAIFVSKTFKALKRRGDVVVARKDFKYDGFGHSIERVDYTTYKMMNGTLFEVTFGNYEYCDIVGDGNAAKESGQHPITATIKSGSPLNYGDGAGLIVTHRVPATVMANSPAVISYGTAPVTAGYTCEGMVNRETQDLVLKQGVTEVDARENSDVGSYEILVAGGKEGHNYTVSYISVPDANAGKLTIDTKALTVQPGALVGTEGETKRWRTDSLTEKLAGLFTNLPAATFSKEIIRKFGERNRVLDNEVTGLITGDSMADLLRGGQVEAFTWLAKDKALSAEAAANRKYPSSTDSITSENSTVHGNATSTITAVESGAIAGNDYVITTSFADSTLYPLNYNVTASTGTQNVYQRPVTITPKTSGILINAGTYTSTSLANAILNQAEINGLASENLLHTYRDLRLSASVPADGMLTPGTKNVTLTIGNTNYCAVGGGQTIDIQVQVANMNGHLTRYEGTATGFKVRVYVNVDGQSKPAEINELRFKIVKRDDPSVVLDSGVMTRVMPNQTFNGIEQSIYETSHVNLIGMGYVKFIFEADGYNFT